MRKTKKDRLLVVGTRPFMLCDDYKGTCLNCQGFVCYPDKFIVMPVGRVNDTTIKGVSLEVFECPHCHATIFLMDLEITKINRFDKSSPMQIIETSTTKVDEEQKEHTEKLIEIISEGIKALDNKEDDPGDS